MARIYSSKIIISSFLGLLFLYPVFSVGQEASATPAEVNDSKPAPAESEPLEPLAIKLSVNEVRLDVVVLDRRGNPVTDLAAKDFEVFQNGARQKIISSVYIDNQSGAAAKPAAARKDNRNQPSLPTADLTREDTRRTIIFVVDDISMSSENGHHTRMALRNFVEKQMQTGDKVAILRTGHGNSALQMFLSDRNQALSRINAMRMEMAIFPNPDGSHLYRVYDNQLSTLNYSLRALKDMPGRKILIMMTATPALRKPDNSSMMSDGSGMPLERIDFHALYNDRFSRLADDALRAGVVVNFLNIGGLSAFDNASGESGGSYDAVREQLIEEYIKMQTEMEARVNTSFLSEQLRREIRDLGPPLWVERQLEIRFPKLLENQRNMSQLNTLNPLPVKTGGVLIQDSNFFLNGIGRETESLMRGYYLISYAPPADTFSSGGKEIFNQIKVNVNRRNVQVHTRDGFYNRFEGAIAAAAPAAHPLQNAVFSPFLHAELNVNIAAGYARDVKAGNLVRSWIHIDPEDIKIVETEGSGARIDLEIVCLTSDTNGFVQDVRLVEHALTIDPENKAENLAWIKKHGIRFAMLLPVKTPGSYYIRVAVQDKVSGSTGSAYQFVEIPDLGRRGLALSNIFMITSADDRNWLISDEIAKADEGLFFPVFQAVEVQSPALRTYAPGDNLQFLAMLYNADDKAIAGSEIEMLFILYRNGVEFVRSSSPVNPGSAGNLDGIPFLLGLTMGTDLPPGDYILELRATDKRNSGRREGNATQAVSFTVTENRQ